MMRERHLRSPTSVVCPTVLLFFLKKWISKVCCTCMCVGQVDAGKIMVAAGESGSEMFFLLDGQMDVRTGQRPMISAITV